MLGEWAALAQLGPVGIVLGFMAMIIRGDLRTKQEVESCEAALARANAQVDALLTAQAKHILATNEALTALRETVRAIN